MYCNNCGNETDESDSFCVNCGNPLNGISKGSNNKTQSSNSYSNTTSKERKKIQLLLWYYPC